MKKIINIMLASVMALTFATSPSVLLQTKPNLQISETTKTSVNSQKEKSDTPYEAVNDNSSDYTADAVTLTAEKAIENTDEADVFYEPDSDSITVLEDNSAYINDAIVVFFEENTDESKIEKIVESIDGEIVGHVDWMNEYEIKIHKSTLERINSVCDELMLDENVEFASCSVASQTSPDYVPDDPWGYYSNWTETSCSDYSTYYNWWVKAVDADLAWDYQDKLSQINVGVLDSGFDTEHEDLQGKISFPNDFFKTNNDPSTHGTHVAGIIGAVHNNKIGISGICPNSNLICVDWQADENSENPWNPDARILSGFVNLVRSGAKVINCSFGSSGAIPSGQTKYRDILKFAEGKFTSYYIAKLLERGYDFICCQSAGNGTYWDDDSFYAVDASNNGTFCSISKKNAVKFVDGVSPDDIMNRIIIVAAATKIGPDEYEVADYSNGGPIVSICAPGTNVFSLNYDAEYPSYDYISLSGTSMSAPIVTGIASMVWSVNQNFTGAQVKHFVCDAENTKISVPDNEYDYHLPTDSYQMVNAKLAVEAAINATADNGTLSGKITLAKASALKRIAFSMIDSESGEVYRCFTDDSGNYSVNLPAGNYVLTVDLGLRSVSYDEEIISGVETTANDIFIIGFSVDMESYAGVIMDALDKYLAKMYIY